MFTSDIVKFLETSMFVRDYVRSCKLELLKFWNNLWFAIYALQCQHFVAVVAYTTPLQLDLWTRQKVASTQASQQMSVVITRLAVWVWLLL